MINILVSSKPVDGLLYYSYEYCNLLNQHGIESQLVIICHKNFSKDNYLEVIKQKYTFCENIIFDCYLPLEDEITLIMGRSMLTLSWINFNDYSIVQQETLKNIFKSKLISVYSENHPAKYPLALEFYNPQQVIDLCDTEVYPNGVGEHFEKRINFDIYKSYQDSTKFEYLFLGTNDKYYATAEKYIKDFPDNGILTYDSDYVNIKNNNIFVPVENLMGMFNTYVYTKETFDPAPRIIQECKYYGKEIIYARDKKIKDGGSVYYKRQNAKPDIAPIIKAQEIMNADRSQMFKV